MKRIQFFIATVYTVIKLTPVKRLKKRRHILILQSIVHFKTISDDWFCDSKQLFKGRW